MAEPEKQYEYGSTPEQEQEGSWPLAETLRGLFRPERREVLTAPETIYEMVSDGRYIPKITPGKYGPVEKGLEHMPVVQAARAALDFAGKFATDGKFREETGAAITKGIGQLFKDYQEGLTYGYISGTDEMSSYDPVEKRVVKPDVLLPLGLGMAASLTAPVKGAGMVTGMFAGRKAATANPKRFRLADEMAKKGRSRKDIWEKTGLFRWERNGEPISDWRFEISDEQAKAFFNPRVLTPTGRFKAGAKWLKGPHGWYKEGEDFVLSDLFEHPEFYKNYPGITEVSGSSLMDDLQKKRAVLVQKLAELKASNKDPDEYAKEYQKLQDQDGDLLREYLESDIPEVKTSITGSEKVGPPYTTDAQRMERPVESISIRPLPSKGNTDAGATYDRFMDLMSFRHRPGGKNLYDTKEYAWIPWDEQGRFFQKFSDVRYGEVLDDAKKDFREAGISLDGPLKGNVPAGADMSNPAVGVEYRLRKWKGGLEDTIDPESLPDYLKKQLDELQAGGVTYYKQKFDADRLFREAAIHEGQHAIQHREGFEGGGSAGEFRYTNIKDPRTGKRLSKKEIYFRLLGEAEARLAESRKDLTDKERKERLPWTKEGGLDRREEDLILRKDPGMPDSYDAWSVYDDPISASTTPAENLMKTRPVEKK